MIAPKKRFEVLKRDNFRCTYCGKSGKDVSLEVDHIISKKNGGDDSIDNLTTCCRLCNMGKGGSEIEEHSKNLYKLKITDTIEKLKGYFQTEWNSKYMGSIDNNTYILLRTFLNNLIKGADGNRYKTYIHYPPLYGPDSSYGEDYRAIDPKKMEILFQKGGDFCNDVLDAIFNEATGDIDYIIEKIFDDNKWLPENNNDKFRYISRLNYKLTELLGEDGETKDYFIKKYTLYPNLLQDGETEVC